MMRPPLPWQTPELTQINRLPMTSCLVPFPDHETALEYTRWSSAWIKSLNGIWRFRLYRRPEDVPQEAAEIAFDDSDGGGYRDIQVPGSWTLQDTGDRPIYTNVVMPFENTPPFVPEDNPTGLFRLSFETPVEWAGRRVVIHLGGVESYYELYVNGHFAGMGKDARLPGEFEITRLIEAGPNQLTVKVLRWSDSSYIEDQDQWWMAGIHRDVYLYSTAAAFVEDIHCQADYDLQTREGILDIRAQFQYVCDSREDPRGLSGPPEDYLLDASLYDRERNVLWHAKNRIDGSYRVRGYAESFAARIPGVDPWSSESPTLYDLVLTLGTTAGQPIESRCVRVGFRNIRIADRELLINGRAVLIRGVNRHEHDERLGKVMTREVMLKDIRLLKQFNFNAVRTSHYPDTMEWYDLCDEYGIYLVDEADIEAHANYATICRDPRWARAFEERIMNMARRDKNHPSIIAWSAGNETGHGPNHARAIEQLRVYDPSRIIHHEGEVKRFWHQGRPNVYTGGHNRHNDLVNPMYPPIEEIIEHAQSARDPRPVILCEYSHAMGNSNGSLAEYWDAFERYQGLQGGFIWEWIDHGILQTDKKGREYWAYGGDFGEEIHDSNFCTDGLVWPDRTPHPGMYEFKKVAQPLSVLALSAREGRFIIRSKQDFTSLSWLCGRWELRHEGRTVDQGVLPYLDIPPGGEMVVQVDYRDRAGVDRPETTIIFIFTAAQETTWCDAGHQVAWEQFDVSGRPLPAPVAIQGEVEVKTEGDRVALRCGDLELSIPLGGDRGQAITEVPCAVLRRNTEVLLARAPRLNLFRATTDNDGIRGWKDQDAKPMGQWLAAGYDRLVLAERKVVVQEEGGNPVVVTTDSFLGTDHEALISVVQSVKFLGAGLLRFDVDLRVPSVLPTLPRVGVILETAQGFEELTWYGRGPHENHIDRKAGYPVGLYSGTVAEQYVPYIMPQENGSKCDVRWFELAGNSRRLRFVADPLCEFSAHHFAPEDLFACRHTPDVEDKLRKETVVCLDLRQRGVGTGSCGPQTRDAYCIPPGPYQFGFYLQVGE